MSYQSTVLADSPAYYWRLNETSGTSFADSAGTNTGTLQGGVTLNQSAPPCDTNSILLNGSTGWVSTSLSNTLSGPYSTEVWFKTTTTTGGFLIAFCHGQTDTSSGDDRTMYMTNSGQLMAETWTSSSQGTTTPLSYNDGQWHHAVATYDGSQMDIYVDGKLVASNAIGTGESLIGYWRIGMLNFDSWPNEPTDKFFTGYMSNVAVYNSVLTATQVQNHYNAATSTQTGTNASITAIAPNVNASSLSPVISTQKQVSVSSVVANENESAISPSITPVKNVSITSTVANETENTGSPSVSTGVNIQSVTGALIASGIAPQIGSSNNSSISLIVANETESAVSPTITTTRNVNINPLTPNSQLSAIPPNIGSGKSVNVNVITATENADGISPVMSTDTNIKSAQMSETEIALSPLIQIDAFIYPTTMDSHADGLSPIMNGNEITGTIDLLGTQELNVNLEGLQDFNVTLGGEVKMTLRNQDVRIFAGESKNIGFNITDVTDLIGATFSWQVKKSEYSTTFIFEKTTFSVNGTKVTFPVSPSDTQNLSGELFHKVKMIDALGNVSFPSVGKLIIDY